LLLCAVSSPELSRPPQCDAVHMLASPSDKSGAPLPRQRPEPPVRNNQGLCDSPEGGPQLPIPARTRSATIWPRVTTSSGQNRSFVGGLQPRVTPAAASVSMSASKTEPSSSENAPLRGRCFVPCPLPSIGSKSTHHAGRSD